MSSDTTYFFENMVLAEHVAAIRRFGEPTLKFGKLTLKDVIEIGRHLTECKAIVGHDYWLSFLHDEFGWTEQTALNFMRVYELSKSKNFLDLKLPISAIYLLARPSTPAKVHDEIFERARAGETVSVAAVERAVEAAKSKSDKPRTKTPDRPSKSAVLPNNDAERTAIVEARWVADVELTAIADAAAQWTDAVWRRVFGKLPFERFLRVAPPDLLSQLEGHYAFERAKQAIKHPRAKHPKLTVVPNTGGTLTTH